MGLDAEPGPCIVLVADLDADVGVRDRGALMADREEGLVADAFIEGCALVADCGGLVRLGGQVWLSVVVMVAALLVADPDRLVDCGWLCCFVGVLESLWILGVEGWEGVHICAHRPRVPMHDKCEPTST